MGNSPTPSVRFRYRGAARTAPEGANLAAALGQGAIPLVQRSVRYHRPRAPFCGIGACTQCLVRVNRVPNVRACTYRPSPGDDVRTENAWPSPGFDLLAVLDPLFRSGIDSVRGFRRPAFARPVYQWVVRRLAAFGRIPEAPPATSLPPPERREVDYLVVGGGAAGRSAAAALAEAGERPLLLDRGGATGPLPGVERLERTTAIFLPAPRPDRAYPFDLLASGAGDRAIRVAAKRVVVATGAYDAGLWLANGDRPGVMTAEGAIALELTPPRPPFRSGVVFGGGARAAELVERWGDHVAAVVAPSAIDPGVTRAASDRGIPLYPRSLVRGVLGRRRVRAVRIQARGSGTPATIAAEALVLAHRRLPHAQLLFQAGAQMRWTPRPGAYTPRHDDGATSVPGLFAVGEVLGLSDPVLAAESGRRGAQRALAGAGPPSAFPADPVAVPSEFESYYRELLALGLGGGRWTACPCEDIGVAELLEAGHRGYRGLEVVKRYTGVGTGLCQGRYCLPEAIVALSLAERRPPAEVGFITQRPPVFPVRLDTLADLPGEP